MSFSSGGGQALGDAVLVLRTDQGPLDRGLASAGANVSRATSQMQTTVDRRMVAMGQSMSRVGSSMTRYLTVPILGAIGAAADLGAKFQASMEQIHTQAGASQKEVANLTGQVLALAKTSSSFTPQQLAQGLYHLESIGLRGSKAMDALKVAMKGAAIGQTDLESTATALGSVWIANIKGGGDLNQIMGSLNATVGAGNVRMQDLVLALGTGIVPAAKLAGLSLQDVEGALAVLTDQGTPASSAAAQLATALHFLYAPTSKADTALKSIGLSSTSMASDMHKPQGLLLALTDLKTHLDKIGGVSSVKAEQVLSAIFPAGRGRVLQTLLNNLDRYQGKLTSITKNSGNLSKDFAATQKTAAYQLKTAWASIESDLVGFGQKVLPDILARAKTVAGFVGTVVTDFTKLPKGMQDAILTGGLIVAGLGPVISVLSKFEKVVGWASKLSSTLGIGGAAAGKITSQVATMEVAEMNVAAMTGGLPAAGAALPAAGAAGATTAETAALTEGGGGAAVATAGISGLAAVAALVAGGATVFLTADAFRAVGGPPSLHQYLDALGVSKPPQGGPGIPTQATPGGPMGLPGAPGSVHQKPGAPTVAGAVPSTTLNPQGFGPTANYAQTAKDINATVAALARLQSGKVSVTQTAVALQNLAKQAAKAHDVGNEFGNAFGAILLKSKNVGSEQVTAMIAELNRLTPAAGKSAAQAMIQMSQSLEVSGKVPVGSTVKLVDEMSQNYDLLKNLSAKDFTQLAQQAGQTMDALKKKLEASSGQQRVVLAAEYNKMQSEVTATLTQLAGDVTVKMSSIRGTVNQKSALAAVEANTNFQKFSNVVHAYMKSGAISTGKGATAIHDELNAALHQLGQKPLPPISVAIGNAITGLAQGGMVEIGRPGTPGRDNVPVTVIAGEGETAMIANRHQRPRMEQWARADGYAGLADFFARNDRPNYMAKGGLLPGSLSAPSGGTGGGNVIDDHPGDMTQGQEPQILQDLYELSAKTATTVEVISGYRTPAHSVAVGGFPDDPHTRGDAADIGPSSLMYRSDIDALLAASNVSGHGLYRPFYPASAAEYNHVQLIGVPLGPIIGQPGTGGGYSPAPGGALGAVAAKIWKQLTAPKVSGSGGYADVIRGALGKLTGAANTYGRKAVSKWNAGHSAGATIGALSGGTVEAQLASALAQVGFNKAAIAGILGNVAQESGFNPTVNAGGLFQFTPPIPGSSGSIAQQVALMMSHGGSGLLGAMNAAGNPVTAATLFMNSFERPNAALANLPNRIAQAQAAYAAGYARGGLIPMASGGHVPGPRAVDRDRDRALAVMKRLWAKSRRFYPGASDHLPPTAFRGDEPFVGDVFSPARPGRGHREILWPDFMTHMLLGLPGNAAPGGGRIARNAGLETLIHEWAHQFQGNSLIAHGKSWEVEGGAQAFTREMAPSIIASAGFPHFALEAPKYDTYYGYVERVRKQLGEDWIRRGQFTTGLPKGFASGGFLDKLRAMASGGMLAKHDSHNRAFRVNASSETSGGAGAFGFSPGSHGKYGYSILSGSGLSTDPGPYGIALGPGRWQPPSDLLFKRGSHGPFKGSLQDIGAGDNSRPTIGLYENLIRALGGSVNSDLSGVDIERADGHWFTALRGAPVPQFGKFVQHAHPHKHQHPHGGKPSHKHPHGHHHKDKSGGGKDSKGKPPPVPTKGIPGVFNIPGAGAGISEQYQWLNELLGTGSTAPWGVPVLSELLGYWPNIWPLENPTAASIMTSPSSAIISTDAAGNQILPYLDTKDLAQARAWLAQQIFWESGLVRDYKTAVPVSNRVGFDLRAEIAKKKREIEARKDKIQKNLKRIADLNHKIAHNTKWIGRTRTLMGKVPTGTSPSQGAGATKPDTAKINGYKAHIKTLTEQSHDWQGQIEGITDQNEKLGGKGVTSANQASGGQIGKINAQITPLQTMLGNVSNPSGTYSPDALTGVTGLGGNLVTEVTTLKTLQGDLAALGPREMAKALLSAQEQASPSLSQEKNSLLLQQVQELTEKLAISQAQYPVLSSAFASLPPFGGSFATGGVVPGMLGEPKTVIAHGGERITPADGGGTIQVIVQDGAVDPNKIQVIAESAAVKMTRIQARQAARVLPGAGGGRRY